MLINNEEYKSYDDNYYVNEYGKIYSIKLGRELKPNIDCDGYYRVDIYGKHIKVHKLVYLTWIGDIEQGKQINHKDDNKHNNHYTNLYLGTQKENILDCFKNNHRVGNIKSVTLKDNLNNKVITFPSIKEFIKYDGHSNKSNSFSKAKNKLWFKKRYTIINIENVETIERYNELKDNYYKQVE